MKEVDIKNAFVVGDYNFDSTWKQEEDVLTNHGMKDIVSNFYDQNAFTMYKTKRYSPWRPDKVVCLAD